MSAFGGKAGIVQCAILSTAALSWIKVADTGPQILRNRTLCLVLAA
jgi:hypothetical protein